MMVPGVVLLIPRFLVLKELSLRNTYPGMILPLVIDCAAIYLMKQNFEQIPKSVEEAAVDRRRQHLPHLALRGAADGASQV